MKYIAFGEIREMNGSSPTDYLYTGQRKEVEFGLSFYNSRWVDCSTAHFVQADTIIPQPGNAGGWDRYAYVLWNPVRYVDPSGHIPLMDGEENSYAHVYAILFWEYNVTLGNDWTKASVGNSNTKAFKIVFKAIMDIGNAIARDMGIDDGARAFRNTFNNGVTLSWEGTGDDPLNPRKGAYTASATFISFYSFSNSDKWGIGTSHDANILNRNLVIHEFGHVFDKTIGAIARSQVGKPFNGHNLIDGTYQFPGLINAYPFPKKWLTGGACDICQEHSEAFANQFEAWVYNAYDMNHDLGPVRKDFMDQYMPIFIKKAWKQ